jgi:hypothetical protein
LLIGIAMIAAIAPAQAQRPDVVYVPTAPSTVERMMEIASVGPRDFLIDLGSGDGRIVIAAAARGARALGIEIDPARIREAKLNARAMGVATKVEFRQEDLFKTSLSGATVVTMYLLPSLNLRLRPRLLQLQPGTRIVSHQFDMKDWKPDATDAGPVLLWIVPAQVAGNWDVTAVDRRFRISLHQQFQEVTGTADIDGRTVTLANARLRGNALEFAVDLGGQRLAFQGAVMGRKMQGKAGATEWVATRP